MKRVSSPIVACDRVNLIRAFNLQTAHPREPFQPRNRYKDLTAMTKNYVVTAHPALRLFGRNIRIEMPFLFFPPLRPPHRVCLGSFARFRVTRCMTNDNNNNYNNPDRRTSARIFNYNIIASRKRALEIFNRPPEISVHSIRFPSLFLRVYVLSPFVACSSHRRHNDRSVTD